MKIQKIKYSFLAAIVLVVSVVGCQDDLKVGTLSVDMKYFDKRQKTTVGFSGKFGDFYFSKSSLPIEFYIENIYEENSGSIEELSEMVKISVYDQAVVNGDSRLALSMKSDTLDVKTVDIDKFTGKLIVHKNSKVLPGTYHFDIRIKNVSGEKVLEDAIVLQMAGFTMQSFSTELGGKPDITYKGASPNQIVFKTYKYNVETKVFDQISTVDHLYLKRAHFEGNNNSYIKDDTHEGGEVWQVEYPITFDGNFYDIEANGYVNKGSAIIDFGQPGSYEVKVFVK
jgi:hypothetical protein